MRVESNMLSRLYSVKELADSKGYSVEFRQDEYCIFIYIKNPVDGEYTNLHNSYFPFEMEIYLRDQIENLENLVKNLPDMKEETKLCTRCKNSKPVSEFAKSSRTKDGLQAWCKDCMKSYKPKKKLESTTYELTTIIQKELSEYSDVELFEELLQRGYEGELHLRIELTDELVGLSQTTKLTQL